MSLLNELLEFVQRVPEVCRTDFRSHVELTDDATSDGIAWQDLNRARRSRGDHRRRRTTENVCGCPWAHVARYGVLAADAVVRLLGTTCVTTTSAEATTPMRSPRWGHVTLLQFRIAPALVMPRWSPLAGSRAALLSSRPS